MFKLAALWSEPTDDFKNNMLQHADYLRYVVGHKYNVGVAGLQAGVNPWTILKHDYSKFRPKMLSTYTEHFFGPKGIRGTNDPEAYKDFREMAEWHYQQEDHHNDKVGLPKNAATEIESVCDWYSVGKTNAEMSGQPFPSFVPWWNDRKNGFLLKGKISKQAYDKLSDTVKNDYNLYAYTIDQIRSLF